MMTQKKEIINSKIDRIDIINDIKLMRELIEQKKKEVALFLLKVSSIFLVWRLLC